MNNQGTVKPNYIAAAVGAAVLSLSTGCALVENPWRDCLAHAPPVTTPSVDAAMAFEATATQAHRHYAMMERETASGAVLHWPLYFEDPYVDQYPPDDGQFAWTLEDLWYAVYGPSRFAVNFVAAPVSKVVNLPWQTMASDGEWDRCDSRRFDAVPADVCWVCTTVATDEKNPQTGDAAPTG
ncbi:MAG: hypothetical protein J5J06_10490 [Phycisphaerae bacterium]|nr:hypothetical protein [Phycisphaerae bacterium]